MKPPLPEISGINKLIPHIDTGTQCNKTLSAMTIYVHDIHTIKGSYRGAEFRKLIEIS